MISAFDIKTWQEEFEKFATKHKLSVEKQGDGYVCFETKKLWDAYLTACLDMVQLVLDRTKNHLNSHV